MNLTTVSRHEVDAPLREVRYDRLATEDEKTWAADNLAALPIKCFADEKMREAHQWVGANGKTYRKCGTIVASPHPDGRFRINWFRGATDDDLHWLFTMVSAAQAGHFGERWGWDAYEYPEDGRTTWQYSLSRRVEPDANLDDASKVVECCDPHCDDFDGGYHIVSDWDSTDQAWHRHEIASTSKYQITLERGENELQWRANVEASDCRLTASEAAGMTSDLHRAVAECSRFNGATVAP